MMTCLTSISLPHIIGTCRQVGPRRAGSHDDKSHQPSLSLTQSICDELVALYPDGRVGTSNYRWVHDVETRGSAHVRADHETELHNDNPNKVA
jgi:hypothetical protein